jgi:hypothetical protein
MTAHTPQSPAAATAEAAVATAAATAAAATAAAATAAAATAAAATAEAAALEASLSSTPQRLGANTEAIPASLVDAKICTSEPADHQ